MNNKAKAKQRAQAREWLNAWMLAHPDQSIRSSPRDRVPIGNNKRRSIGKTISSAWGRLRNPSPRKPGLWGWHKS